MVSSGMSPTSTKVHHDHNYSMKMYPTKPIEAVTVITPQKEMESDCTNKNEC